MNNVFLGKPPASIEAWIKSHRPTPPVSGPLCFTAQAPNSKISLQNVAGTYKTSPDGMNWYDYTLGTEISLSIVGTKVYFSAKTTNETCFLNYETPKFQMSGKIAASGNIQSLLDETCQRMDVPDKCYFGMFNSCSSLVKAPELPATTLADSCYECMFSNCTSLTQAPELPATTLAYSCYEYMFSNCTSLTQAPELPATTLADSCYCSMFRNCTSLMQAPELPATTLAYSCYFDMFSNCTSLTQAPELPATTLADTCYQFMFTNCTSLTQAPELPATTLADSCYTDLFYRCQQIQELKINQPIQTVIENARVWGIGIPAKQVVVVHCIDGILVLNDRSQSSDGVK